MWEFIYLYLVLLVTAVLARPLLTLVHELGHAATALWFTNSRRVEVFVGTSGEREGGYQRTFGRLSVFWKVRSLWKVPGLMRHDCYPAWFYANHLILLAGPLGVLLLTVALVGLAFTTEVPILLQVASLGLLAVAVNDLFFNLVPSRRPIVLANGHLSYNDGYQIWQLLRRGKDLRPLYEAHRLLTAGDKQAALDRIRRLLREGNPQPESVTFTLDMLVSHGAFQEATDLAAALPRTVAGDWINMGIAYGHLNQLQEAMDCFDRAEAEEPDNPLLRSNRGYTWLVQADYDRAMAAFEWVLARVPEDTYTLANRGLARIRLGEQTAGLNDLNRALTLDPDQAYAHRNLGIYYWETGQRAKARLHFEKARTIAPHTHQLEEWLRKTGEA